MEMSLLRLVYGQTLPGMTEAEAQQLEQILQLVESTWDLHTEPDELAGDVLARLGALGGFSERVFEMRRDIDTGRTLTLYEWSLLSLIASFKWILQCDAYSLILSAYPDVGEGIGRLLEVIERVPFAGAMTSLEEDWGDIGSKPEFDWVALTYIRACGRIEVFAGNDLYEKIAQCLAYNVSFLVVILAAACFKVPAIAARVDIGAWTDTQYACMRLLDNFVHLGETAWG